MGSTSPAHVCHFVTTLEEESTLVLDFVSGSKAKRATPDQPLHAETVVSGDHQHFVLSEQVEVAGIQACRSVNRTERKREVGVDWVAGAAPSAGPEAAGAAPGSAGGAAAGANASDPEANGASGPASAVSGAVVSAIM